MLVTCKWITSNYLIKHIIYGEKILNPLDNLNSKKKKYNKQKITAWNVHDQIFLNSMFRNESRGNLFSLGRHFAIADTFSQVLKYILWDMGS